MASPEAAITKNKSTSHTLRWLWISEVLAIIGTSLCFVALVIVLLVFDGRPIFSWKKVSLNTIVSILSTALTMTLMVAVSASMGQWKWILFQGKKRRLLEFQEFDKASHSQWGSLKLFLSGRKIILWRIGALVSLLTTALDPFTQQLVQLEQKLHSASESRTVIAISNRYSKGNEHGIANDEVAVLPGGKNSTLGTAIVFADADSSMQSAFLYGLTQPLSSVIQQLPFQCSTGNCTWSAFQSLAVCSICNNVSSQLETIDGLGNQYGDLTGGSAATTTSNATEFRLPNGVYINNFNGVRFNGGEFRTDNGALGIVLMATSGTGNASQTNSFHAIDTLIWAMSFLRMRPDPKDPGASWPNTPLEALECGLYYCVKSFQSAVVDGTLVEIESVLANVTRSPGSWALRSQDQDAPSVLSASQITSLEFDSITSFFLRTDLMLGQDFNVSQVAVDSISSYLQTQLAGGFYVNGTEGSGIEYKPSSSSALFASPDINATFIALARSMSNALRAGSDGPSVLSGATGTLVTYYKIFWPWITLHAVVLVLGMVFLLLTIWKSRSKRMQVWKTSSLAIMAVGANLMGLLGERMTLEEMKMKARENRVLLLGGGEKFHDANMVPLEYHAPNPQSTQPAEPSPSMESPEAVSRQSIDSRSSVELRQSAELLRPDGEDHY